MGTGASSKSADSDDVPQEPAAAGGQATVVVAVESSPKNTAASSSTGEQSPKPKEGGVPALGGSSLAARRAAQGKLPGSLSVKVEKVNPRRVVLGQLHRSKDNAGNTLKQIQKLDAFTNHFKIGTEVMPSVHPGMEVRHAKDLKEGRSVVVKLRKKSNSFANQQEEKEWRQSAEFMLNLPESNSIARIFGVYEDRESYYVVMERVGGSDLFELLDAEGMLPLGETKAILRQLLRGVLALHEEGCIHKDLKLENVMVDRTSQRAATGEPVVKLIDFDTAMTWEPDSPKAKTVLGTDQYISAEAYAGKYSPASDIFAVGVIAYKLVSGYFPFNGKMFDDEAGENWVGSPKMKQIADRVSHARINWNIKPFPNEPDAVDLIRKMLAPNDNDRPLAEEALVHPFLADPASPTIRKKQGSQGF